MLSASEYREKRGVVRMAVGQLGFTPEQMQANVKAFMDSVKVEIAKMKGKVSKEVHEAVRLCLNEVKFYVLHANPDRTGPQLNERTRFPAYW